MKSFFSCWGAGEWRNFYITLRGEEKVAAQETFRLLSFSKATTTEKIKIKN
jgi:hypothetical protein